MKKISYSLCALVILSFLCNDLSAQNANQEKKVTVSYTWSRIQSHGSNQIAIWIEDLHGKHIRTLFATHFTAAGGYKNRPVSLSEWTAKFGLKDATKESVDAVSGSTPKPGKQIVYWNGTDQSGRVVPAGTYVVRMEANILNTDKMFFRGEINIGGSDQKTAGEITFSKPELASGKVLFSDVLVEYK
jgi:hypothetical protein